SPGPDTPFQATLRPRLHSIVPPTRGQGRWSCPKFINHKGHEGARRKSLEFAPSCAFVSSVVEYETTFYIRADRATARDLARRIPPGTRSTALRAPGHSRP